MTSPLNPNLPADLPPIGLRRVVYLEANRPPTTADTKYRSGAYYEFNTEWRDTSASPPEIWKLVNITSRTNAIWEKITGDAGPLVQFTVPFGSSPVTPNGSGNITLTSSGETVTITGSTNAINFDVTGTTSGIAQTIGAVTADVITLDLGSTPGTYQFDIRVAAFDSATPLSAGYSVIATVRTTGAAATVIGVPDKVVAEEGALSAGNLSIVGSGNNMIVRALGTAGKTVNWRSQLIYTFGS